MVGVRDECVSRPGAEAVYDADMTGSVAVAAVWGLVVAQTPELELGRALVAQGEFERARVVLRDAVRAGPGGVEYRYLLGVACLKLGDAEAAIEQFEVIARDKAKDTAFAVSYREALERRVAELAGKLAGLPESSARRAHHLAKESLMADRVEEALRLFRQAAVLDGAMTGIYADAGEALWVRRRYQEAAAAFAAELERDENAFLPNLRLGQYLLGTKRTEEAVPHLITAARHQRLPEAHQLLAYAYDVLERRAEAKGVLETARELFPYHGGVKEALAGHSGKAVPMTRRLLLRDRQQYTHLLRRREDEEAWFHLHQIYAGRVASLRGPGETGTLR
ncbi:MAG: tetratricopeptide repeat protein [Acidobacteria bacterium]|nr:tetratricopeptide repeat protein [Acidobacteriota bacterium]